MHLQLGDVAPNFQAQSTHGDIDFYKWIDNSWVVLFSHPKDFTPVCTTELGEFAKRQQEFLDRHVKLISVSVDSLEKHETWRQDIEEISGSVLSYPLIADPHRTISELYGMIHAGASDSMTVRSLFVIGPDKILKLMINYPASTGRSVDEVIRVIDSLQLTHTRKLATPVNWQSGDDAIIVPSVPDDEANALFPQGWKSLKPYIRLVKGYTL